ncbi:MAG: patatin-like phospholipase family protein [Deltaproteobacteria bacterium]|nr:patatin-like phospholipase family protein [Deltaproteobacteria bacterium]
MCINTRTSSCWGVVLIICSAIYPIVLTAGDTPKPDTHGIDANSTQKIQQGNPATITQNEIATADQVPSIIKNEFTHATGVSLTIRGGSSLGAYEAGYLYMLTEAIKRNPQYFTAEVLSGASAGAINST